MPPSKARGGGSGGQRGAVRTIIQPKQHHRAQAAVLVRPTPTPSPSEESPAPQEEEQQQPKKRKCPLEQAPPLEVHQRFYALSQQRCTGAYDDDRQQQQQQQQQEQSRSKRQKTVQQEQERSGKRSRDEMEKPVRKPDYCDRYNHGHGGAAADLAMMRLPRALRNGNGQQQQQQQQQSDPVASMGLLGWLPAETRDQILRYVLVWPQDIRVLQGWSLVFPRTRPHLEVAILRTCEVLRRQGARILYGENRFVHLVRDPPAANAATPHVLREVYGGSWIPVRRYGHLIRDVAIVVEANRMADWEHRQNFVRSIAKLGPGGGLPFPANLHTVTIEVPALAVQDLNGWHTSDSDLSSVPICEFFDEKAVKALTSLNTKFVRVLATDRYGRLLESVIDLRYYSTKLHHDNINNNNDEHHREDDPATRDQVLMDSREERARKAMARLRTIRYNLQLLTLYPRKAIKERRIWTVVQREKPNIEIFELAEDHIDIDELESPSPQPPKKRVKNKQLTEKWLEQTEAANGEDADAMDTNSPLDNLERKLNRLKVASPAKAPTATTSSAHKGKGKAKAKTTTVAAPKIKLCLKASRSKKPTAATAAEVTPTSAEASKKKPKKKKPSKDESRPPLSDAAQKRMNERINSINQKAAPAVAAMKADRIAAEKKKAAEEAVAAAREAMKTAQRDAAEKKKRADEAKAAHNEAVAVAKQANAELEAATQGSRQGSGRGRENQVATTGSSSASFSQNLAQSQEQASSSSSSSQQQADGDGDGDVSMGL